MSDETPTEPGTPGGPADDEVPPGPDPTAGRPPSVEGGLTTAAGDEGTSGINMSGVTPPAQDPAEGEPVTPLDQVVEGGSRAGWGRGRDVEPGESPEADAED
jgi:hypothetical protein